jgi:anthranilate synthase/aminodeoxychorismate synthase-like glutamine amidotransferase
MILVIDNYDSFTYNLVQQFAELGAVVHVCSNDGIDLAAIERLAPEAIVLSPGPGAPEQAGITLEVARRLGGRVPLLGVCLGHQAIGHAFGARVVRAKRLMHGRTSRILHDQRGLFAGVPDSFAAMRYNSLILDPATLHDCFELSAWTAEGEVMAIRHRRLPVQGVQFHPESILTEHGHALLSNFLATLPCAGARPLAEAN